MPLEQGKSRDGRPPHHAVTIALDLARRARASGGRAHSGPTQAQKEAGNYRKRSIQFHGLNISIENEKGSRRSGVSASGKAWGCVLPAAYGYIRRTDGADGDHVDCYVGPHRDSFVVFVVDQKHPHTGSFDEHKCMLGFRDEAEARKIYNAGFSDGSGPKRLAAMTTMSLSAFKDWLKSGKTKRPMQERRTRASGGATVTRVHVGPIHSPVAGRTDHLPMNVPSGSYVIPADIISAMGEGNTIAGFKQMRRLFGGAPYTGAEAMYGAEGGPYNEPLPGKSEGGEATVPIIAAGGEYVLSPAQVTMAGDGDMDAGHRVLDEFVKRMRAKTIETLSNLPGPKKD